MPMRMPTLRSTDSNFIRMELAMDTKRKVRRSMNHIAQVAVVVSVDPSIVWHPKITYAELRLLCLLRERNIPSAKVRSILYKPLAFDPNSGRDGGASTETAVRILNAAPKAPRNRKGTALQEASNACFGG